MEKTKVNFIVDALMFLGMGLLAGTGLLIKFVLLPGSERAIVYGQNVQLYFWGLDRHEWGTLHLYIAYVLVALVILHIILHLKWIYTVFARFISDTYVKTAVGIGFVVLGLLCALFPFIITPEIRYRGGGSYTHTTELSAEHEDGADMDRGEGRRQRGRR